MFNNERNYERAYSEHLAAWDRQVGRFSSPRTVSEVFQHHGGDCSWSKDASELTCAVDVLPRTPSLTSRIQWVMSFARHRKNKVRLIETRLDHLGMDW